MTKKYDVYLTQHAQADLEHIYDYIASDSVENAVNFIIQIEKKVYSLENIPHRNPLIQENEYFRTDYRHLIHKKYRIIYRIVENSVYILRIIHGAKILEL